MSHNVFAIEGFEIFQKLPKRDGDMTQANAVGKTPTGSLDVGLPEAFNL